MSTIWGLYVKLSVGTTATFAVLSALSACASVEAPQANANVSAECAASQETRPERERVDSLALSGGGYRAALFHIGALWRLNEVGLLDKVGHVSSVSGGSIVAGVLAINWARLNFDSNGVAKCFPDYVVKPLLELTSNTLDAPSIVLGAATPFADAPMYLEQSYAKHLFGELTLQSLPDSPEFIFNATSLQTGEIWRFTKRYAGDNAVGYVGDPKIPLSKVVAASSAYPPLLSPVALDLKNNNWIDSGQEYKRGTTSNPLSSSVQKDIANFRQTVLLTDGGIGDNLGTESVWTNNGRLFASDGGSGFDPSPTPSTSWMSQTLRVVSLIHGQPSQLRTNMLIDRFRQRSPDGLYWSILGPQPRHKECLPIWKVSGESIARLASIPTRLAALGEKEKKELINWGYSAAEAALPYLDDLWVSKTTPGVFRWSAPPPRWPYQDAALPIDEEHDAWMQKCLAKSKN